MLRASGEVAGVSSVYPADVPLIGGRRFWIYRNLLDPAVAQQRDAMIKATFNALDAEFDGSPEAPIGLCVLIADPEERRRRPDAEWLEPRLLYAGYLGDGQQVRIAYFEDAEILVGGDPDLPTGSASSRFTLAPGYRIARLAGHGFVSERDVIELWLREGGLSAEEAERRVGEVLLVATDPSGRLAGICTVYLRRNEQLRADMWHYRVFVASAHRRGNIMMALGPITRDYLERRFVRGEDRRGIGMVMEVENKALELHFPQAWWYMSDFTFIGESAVGAHVRVHYFLGAMAPEPDG